LCGKHFAPHSYCKNGKTLKPNAVPFLCLPLTTRQISVSQPTLLEANTDPCLVGRF
ncbi:unnamed protein product, partial [Tenebrio molitor]